MGKPSKVIFEFIKRMYPKQNNDLDARWQSFKTHLRKRALKYRMERLKSMRELKLEESQFQKMPERPRKKAFLRRQRNIVESTVHNETIIADFWGDSSASSSSSTEASSSTSMTKESDQLDLHLLKEEDLNPEECT